MKPIALDLCCGKGGWTIGLQKAGWEVIGVDIEAWPGYPGDKLVVGDVRKMKGADFPGVRLVCASPPCQEFSYRSFPFKRCRELAANVPPDKSIWEACVRIAKECAAPLILENVRGAQKYMGKAQAHYGSFYLWGDVPALLPIGRPQKGFGRVKDLENPSDPWGGFGGSSYQASHPKGEKFAPSRTKAGFAGERDRVRPVYAGKKMVGSEKDKNRFEDHPSAQMSSKSNVRKEWSATAAMIPTELAERIGQCFMPNE